MAVSQKSNKIYAYIWFDVEDYVTPETNDVPLQAIKILKKYNIPVTTKMVAEKVRFMKKQNRGDVISAIKNFCDVGFHTDTHSRHPIVFEYISDLDVVKGAKEIERRERPGLKEVKNTFGYVPSCFGHAGTQWAPHYYPYLRKNGINVYLDSTDLVNIDDSPYWYCGVLSLNNTDKNFIRFDRSFEDPEGSEKLKKRFQDIHDRLQKSGGGAISILWHPHTGINKVYWDALNFSNGQNTPEGNYIQPEQYPLETKERALQDFESLIKFGSSFKDVRFISATDSLKIYRRDLDIVLDVSGIRKIASALSRSDEISYMKLGDEYISPSQEFCALVNFAASYSKSRRIPKRIATSEPLGPMSPFSSKVKSTDLLIGDLLLAAEKVSRFIALKGFMPSSIKVGSSTVLEPSDFLSTLARLILMLLSKKRSPSDLVALRRARMISSEKYVNDSAFNTACKWAILPRDFNAPKILEQAKLQIWTLVPAIARAARS
jgi:hypothetical protein